MGYNRRRNEEEARLEAEVAGLLKNAEVTSQPSGGTPAKPPAQAVQANATHGYSGDSGSDT